jgi:CubicO group peptidase (beta-lactamase class C family)
MITFAAGGWGASGMMRLFAWLTRRRRLAALTALLVVVVVSEVYLSGVSSIRQLRGVVQCAGRWSHAADRLQCLVDDAVGSDAGVRGVELAVATGDGSYAWAGAAGFADPRAGAGLTKDDPIYIASVTKIYIAALVMLVSQARLVSLDDPMARYLPAELVDGLDVYGGRDNSLRSRSGSWCR